MPKVSINNVVYDIACGTCLSDVLSGLTYFEMPCAAKGICGKCKVTANGALSKITPEEINHLTEKEISQGIRLACRTKVEGDCSIEILDSPKKNVCLSGEVGQFELNPGFSKYGVALDIGTTTLAARLYDIKGEILSEIGEMNPQRNWGADVISRIEASLSGESQNITASISKAIDDLLVKMAAHADISTESIDSLVITGNTVMLSFLTATCVESLSKAPFIAKRLFGEKITAKEIGLISLMPNTEIFLPDCVAAFIGADVVTAILASNMCDFDKTLLLVDIGTNGEMALWHNKKLYFCSTAAGPAFEGVGISMGMSGQQGAIDHVEIEDNKLSAHTIGEVEAVGICGSGIIDAVACLVSIDKIDETGYMAEEPAIISSNVYLNQKDIRAVQLSKSAVCSGILTLLNSVGINCEKVDKLFIAGGFGNYINIANAGKIGLLPNELIDKVQIIGNAALSGASMMLLNKNYQGILKSYMQGAEIIELSTNTFFMEQYVENMMF